MGDSQGFNGGDIATPRPRKGVIGAGANDRWAGGATGMSGVASGAIQTIHIKLDRASDTRTERGVGGACHAIGCPCVSGKAHIGGKVGVIFASRGERVAKTRVRIHCTRASGCGSGIPCYTFVDFHDSFDLVVFIASGVKRISPAYASNRDGDG